jgi:hypothetical protein
MRVNSNQFFRHPENGGIDLVAKEVGREDLLDIDHDLEMIFFDVIEMEPISNSWLM